MNEDDAINHVIEWFDNYTIVEEENDIDFHIEEYEHSITVRWGSEKGDFPTFASGFLSEEHYIITSGEIKKDGLIVADDNAKIPFKLDQMVYKYLLETQMEGCNGYELPQVITPNGDVFCITVKKLK